MARADETPPAAAPTDTAPTGTVLTTWALHWITEAMAGRTDRSQYAPAFAPKVTDEAVARMAHVLNAYGAAPLRAEIVQTKKKATRPSPLSNSSSRAATRRASASSVARMRGPGAGAAVGGGLATS